MSFSSSMSKQQVLEVAGDEVGGGGGEEVMELIPGLPEEVAEKCLLHLPFLYHRLFRTVSSTWNRFLTVSPAKFPSAAAASVSLSLPFLFAFAFDPASRRLQCQALDPFSRRWLLLPPVPGGAAAAGSFAVVGLPRRGEIYVKLYVTEGWAWPFERAPRGAVYDAASDSWSEMARGMREGWTGSCAVAGGRMYIVAEYGEWRLKRYDEPRDEWRMVAGSGVPPEVRRPHVVSGEVEEVGSGGRRRIYVVGAGLDVAIGTVSPSPAIHGGDDERVDWEVVKGPAEFAGLAPCNAQVLYA